MKIETGDIVMTIGIATKAWESAKFEQEVKDAVERFKNGDWGNSSPDDVEANKQALETKDKGFFAVYHTCEEDIFIVTDDGRKNTTVLLAEEY